MLNIYRNRISLNPALIAIFVLLSLCLCVGVYGAVPKGTTGPVVEEPSSAVVDPGSVVKVFVDNDAKKAGPPPEYVPKAAGWSAILTEGFEGIWPWGSWGVTGNPTWNDDDFKPYIGYWSAWCANGGSAGFDPATSDYPINMDAWMIYGPFSLVGCTDAQMRFFYWLESEFTYDFFGWYWSANGTNFYGTRVSGTSAGWKNAYLDLGHLCGDSSVWIGFRFTSDYIVNYKGAFVDDIYIEKYNTPDCTTAPTVTSFAINNGNASTTSQNVTLNNITTGSPTEYMASESASFAGASWQSYSTAPSFTLSAGYGTKTVYFKTRNACGESNVMSDTIQYSGGGTCTQPPLVTYFAINNGASSTTSQTVTLNNTTTNNPTEYIASHDSTFAGASWQPYSAAPSFTMSAGSGIKKVYFKTRNDCGVSNTKSDTIVYTGSQTCDPPVVTYFAINNGAASTTSPGVLLNNTTTNSPTEYMASESASFAGASWLPYSTAPSFTLSAGYGTKTVYFKTKNACGESNVMSDTIQYSGGGTCTQPPLVTYFAINNGASSTTNPDVTLNNTTTNSPTEYIASHDSTFAGASWLPYSTAPSFTMSAGSGVKKVYFKTRNTCGVSNTKSDTIILQEGTSPGTPTRIMNFAANPSATNIGLPTELGANLQRNVSPYPGISGQMLAFKIQIGAIFETIPDDGISSTSFMTDANGYASVFYTPPPSIAPGTYSIKVEYAGSTSYGSSSATSTLVINKAQWTFLVYLDADNNLEPFGLIDYYDEIYPVVNTNVNIVVLFDRHPGYDTSDGNWTTTREYVVTTTVAIYTDLGEQNMGHPNTLTAFINSNRTRFVSYNYALVLWNHGSGWRLEDMGERGTAEVEKPEYEQELSPERKTNLGMYNLTNLGRHEEPVKAVCVDESNGYDALYMSELSAALSSATGGGANKLHILAFDACLMGMFEVAYQVRSYVSYMVGSEDVILADGFEYQNILNTTSLTATTTPAGLATVIVQKYQDRYPNPPATLAAWNLANFGTPLTALNNFANAMIANMASTSAHIGTARSSTQDFPDMDEYQIDACDFAKRLRDIAAVPAAVKTAADNLINSVSNTSFTISRYHSSGYFSTANMRDIAVYFPMSASDPAYYNYFSSGYLAFASQSWDDFLSAYFGSSLARDISEPVSYKLGQNYPNPFNPETWIPYQLQNVADVEIRIYASTGQLVRTLTLGHKSAGFYTDKSRAAYWNGRNEAGERVASGVYFYTIKAGDFTCTKKMLVVE